MTFYVQHKMSFDLIQHFFTKVDNQRIVHDLLNSYQQRYSNSDKKFSKFILYEIVNLVHSKKDENTSVKSILEEENRHYSFFFDSRQFSNIKQTLEEETKFLENPVTVEDGVVECKKCKSLKTISFAKQTRGSDEGTSVFVTCVMCQFKFRL